jgi:hypothetical protein
MLSAEQVRQLLDYDPATGIFKWRAKPGSARYDRAFNSRCAGKIAGRSKPNANGYLEIRINGVLYTSGRVAWAYMTGRWPDLNIDHIDTDKANNRWNNLREATVAQNGWNTGLQLPRNNSGFKGVFLCRPTGRYYAQIAANGRRYHLGHFASPKEAHAAYVAAAQKYHGEFARAA